MNLNEELIAWEESIHNELQRTMDDLSKELSDEPEELIRQVTRAESLSARLGSLLSMANNLLDRAKFVHFPDKEPTKTESWRKAKLDHNISPFRLIRDNIETLNESIKQRIMVGQSILKYFGVTHAIQIKERSPF